MNEEPLTHAKRLAQLADRKAVADAELAALNAEKSVAAARLAVPASGVTGTVTLKDDAGSMETALLAGHAVKRAARIVADAVLAALPTSADGNGGKTVATMLVVTAAELPRFELLQEMLTHRDLVLQSLVQGNSEGDAALTRLAAGSELPTVGNELSERTATPPAPSTSTVVATAADGLESVAGVGLALQATTALLGFFKSDFEVAGRSVETNDALLARAVAGALVKPESGEAPVVHLPGTLDPSRVTALAEKLRSFTAGVAFQRRKAEAARGQLHQELDRLAGEDALITDDTPNAAVRRAELTRRRAGIQSEHDALQKLVVQADAFLTAPFPEGVNGAAALREWMLWDRMQQPSVRLLVLKMEQSGGSSYTTKNLWTAFGRMPYHVSAGVVVSYQLFDGVTGALSASGVVPLHGGFITPRELAWRAP